MKPAAWLNMLSYGDSWDPDAHFILDGIYHGFHMVDPCSSLQSYHMENYGSALTNHHHISELLDQEITQGKLSITEIMPTCVHSLGAIIKPSGKIRPITDCSRPKNVSVNNYMDEVFSSFCYTTIDKVVSAVKCGSYMCTVDIQSAYRSIAIHPDDRTYFGLKWDFGNGKGDVLMTDNYMCFGSRSAPFLFSRLTDSISRYM